MLPVIKRRLHRQIYFTVVACLVAVVAASGIFFAVVDRTPRENPFKVIAQLVAVAVADIDASQQQQQSQIEKIAANTEVNIALFDRSGKLIASTADFRVLPDQDELEDVDRDDEDGWDFDHKSRSWITRLPDGRIFAATYEGFRGRPPLLGLLIYVIFIALVIGLAAWPFVRRLTSRLNRLEDGVRRIGEGDLSTRVDVEGQDEIASLAGSFNTSAERIEQLVNSSRQLLAHASHELRTPLARVRLGVEMLREKEDPKRRAALEHDIGELDSLIDEILTMSRLDTGTTPQMNESIDLLALAAEECARYEDCTLYGEPIETLGNSKLLSRLVRNLLDNAMRHGKAPVEVSLTNNGKFARLTVEDSGDGIPPEQREKIFSPFYRGAGKQNIEGYGLGLALVTQIAKAHGGSVRVDQDKPSRFVVELPVH